MCYHWVGSHIAVVAVNIVDDAVAEEVVECGAHYYVLEGVEGVQDLSAVGWSLWALEEVVVVFVCLSACTTLAFFISPVAFYSATSWEFPHGVFVCEGLILLSVFGID